MKYAIVLNGKIKSLVDGDYENQPNYLPVEYEKINLDEFVINYERKSRDEWIIKNDKVIITYNVYRTSFEYSKNSIINKLSELRDLVIDGGIEVDLGDGIIKPVMTFKDARVTLDQASLDAERRPDNWSKSWKFADKTWMKINSEQLEIMRSKVSDHVEMCFRYEQLIIEKVLKADTFSKLKEINYFNGWPKTYFDIGLEYQQNTEFLIREV